jgi:hypothetical protein
MILDLGRAVRTHLPATRLGKGNLGVGGRVHPWPMRITTYRREMHTNRAILPVLRIPLLRGIEAPADDDIAFHEPAGSRSR